MNLRIEGKSENCHGTVTLFYKNVIAASYGMVVQ